MARNRRTSKPVRIEPAASSFTMTLPASASSYVDLSQCASIVNRRFYRQGLNWAVSGFRVGYSASGGVHICKLQNTWVTSQAWKKSFMLWKQQQDEAMEDSGSDDAIARFRDFKIHMNAGHVAATFGGNILPVDGYSNPFVAGEWDPSYIVLPNDGAPGNSVEYRLKMHGTDAGGAKGMIQGYSESRAMLQSPDPVVPVGVSASWMNEMFDVGDDNALVTQNAIYNNNELPYDQDEYPGGSTNAPNVESHRLVTFTASNTSGGGIIPIAGGNFPCGLIEITNLSDSPLTLQIILAPGSHRGYLAETMEEF